MKWNKKGQTGIAILAILLVITMVSIAFAQGTSDSTFRIPGLQKNTTGMTTTTIRPVNNTNVTTTTTIFSNNTNTTTTTTLIGNNTNSTGNNTNQTPTTTTITTSISTTTTISSGSSSGGGGGSSGGSGGSSSGGSTLSNVARQVKNIPTADKEDFYRENLRITSNISVNKLSIDKLVEENLTDRNNFENIVEISLNAEETRREIIANELSDMNTLFVGKISRIQESQIKDQIRNYIFNVEKPENIRINLDKERIKTLFRKDIDIDTFINEIWGE